MIMESGILRFYVTLSNVKGVEYDDIYLQSMNSKVRNSDYEIEACPQKDGRKGERGKEWRKVGKL